MFIQNMENKIIKKSTTLKNSWKNILYAVHIFSSAVPKSNPPKNVTVFFPLLYFILAAFLTSI